MDASHCEVFGPGGVLLLGSTSADAHLLLCRSVLADVMVGPQSLMPIEGWPAEALLKGWHEALAAGPDDPARRLAEVAVRVAAEAYPDQKPEPLTMSALDLTQLDQVTRVLDTLMLALMQSLGDDIIWQ